MASLQKTAEMMTEEGGAQMGQIMATTCFYDVCISFDMPYHSGSVASLEPYKLDEQYSANIITNMHSTEGNVHSKLAAHALQLAFLQG